MFIELLAWLKNFQIPTVSWFILIPFLFAFIVIAILAIGAGTILMLANAVTLFTKGKEGKIAVIERNGTFDSFLPLVLGWKTHPETHEMIEGYRSLPKRFLERWMGVYWIGIFTTVAEFLDFQTTQTLVALFATNGKIPVRARFQLTTRIKNPYLKKYMINDSQAFVAGHAFAKMRDLIGASSIEELTENPKENLVFKSEIYNLNNDLERIGEEITFVNFLGYEPVTDPQTALAITEYYRKQQEARGMIPVGEAKAKTIGLVNAAVLVSGDKGVQLRAIDAFESSDGKLVVTDTKGGILPILPTGQNSIIAP